MCQGCGPPKNQARQPNYEATLPTPIVDIDVIWVTSLLGSISAPLRKKFPRLAFDALSIHELVLCEIVGRNI
jgi:hypothetical protein